MMLSLPLQDFLRTVEDLAARDLPVSRLIELLEPEFARLVLVPDLLGQADLETTCSAYGQRVLHADAGGRFSLVSLHWRPGARTPVHDHLAWGLAAVYRGHELETRYAWCDRPGRDPALRPADVRTMSAGEVLPILPPSDIHRVANPDPTPSVSLHLYGLDLRHSPSGSSVRRVYGPELLVAGAPEAHAAAV